MFFSRRTRAANSAVCGPFWPDFELLVGFISEPEIKIEGIGADTALCIHYFRRSRTAHYVVSGGV